DDKLMLEPYYDDFYEFDYYTNLAVVVKNNKYGFLNKQGAAIIPLIFDDAFDFETYLTTIVKVGEKYGLIDLKGKVVLQPIYEELNAIGNNELYSAKLANKYGVISSIGKVKIDFTSDNAFEFSDCYFSTKVNGQKAAKIYTANFIPIGDFPTSALEGLSHQYILVKPHKNQQKHKIFNAKGNLLVDEFDKISHTEYLTDAIVILKNKKKGVLSLEKSSLIIPFEYDQILEMVILSNGSDSQNILRLENDGLLGIKDITNPEKKGQFSCSGNLQKVLQESLTIARLVALRFLPADKIKEMSEQSNRNKISR
ncbi:MAG: WG repeat-containing protein, partial [Pedobacter sp.]